MFVRFWGVRGSYPVPGSATSRYGGQTACVEVCPAVGTLLILDAGTGIRKLGQRLVSNAGSVTSCHLLISHTHWDHIQGLPFFSPLYGAGNQITIYARQREVHLSDIFASQTKDPFFPVGPEDVGADVAYRELIEGARFNLGANVSVRCARLNHPYIAVGYRIDADGGSVAYIVDTAPFDRIVFGHDYVSSPPDLEQVPQDAATLSAMHAGVVDLCRDADLVIYDTMFEMHEYRRYPHWGHSAPEHALALVAEAGAHALALFHHHPSRTDVQQDAIVERVSAQAESSLDGLVVLGAREGMEVACRGGSVEVRG